MRAQDALRAASQLLSTDLKRVGVGAGTARLALGDAGGVRYAYALQVLPAEALGEEGPGAPPAPYPPSDALSLRPGDATEVLELADCTAGAGEARARVAADSGRSVCLAAPPARLREGDDVLFVHPTRALACAQRVTGAAAPNAQGVWALPVGPRTGLADVPAGHPCAAVGGRFWSTVAERPLLVREEAWAYRVSWRVEEAGAEPQPVLQVRRGGAGGTWADLVHGVERLTVRLGVADRRAPGVLLWFPDATRPPLEACDVEAACDADVAALGGYVEGPEEERTDLPEGSPGRARDALLRRVQAVELTLVVRSLRRDEDRVRRNPDGTFAQDADGFWADGYRRRSTTLRLTPRNFAVAGLGEP